MNTNDGRGKIKHIERAQQINNFEQLRYGNITPTDIDGLIEYKNKAYVIFEIKYQEARAPYGQKLAMERFVDDVTSNRKQAVAFICEHQVHNTNNSVNAAECMVRELYMKPYGCWKPMKKPMNLKEAIDIFILFVDKP